MELKKQVCSLELAKKLKKLGAVQESLYFWVEAETKTKIIKPRIWRVEDVVGEQDFMKYDEYSAFTVAELGEILPFDDVTLEYSPMPEYYSDTKWVCITGEGCNQKIIAETEANARAKMLIYLKENKLI